MAKKGKLAKVDDGYDAVLSAMVELLDALVHKLEEFLLELGSDFAFIGRQKRLRIGDEWYRIDLLFFHRKLRCLVVISESQGFVATDFRDNERGFAAVG